MSSDSIIDDLHPLEIRTLRGLESGGVLSGEELAGASGLEEAQVRRAIELLRSREAVEIADEKRSCTVSLTETGRAFAGTGTPEMRLLDRIDEETTMATWRNQDDMDPKEVSTAIGALKKGGLIRIVEGGRVERNQDGDMSRFEALKALLDRVTEAGSIDLSDLDEPQRELVMGSQRKRGKEKGIFRVDETVSRSFRLTTVGVSLCKAVIEAGATGEELSKLTPQMLKDGSWRKSSFRPYNISLKPPRIVAGKRHPYLEYLDFVKRKLIALGFEEMTGPFVEPEFWIMDALYMPQFHAARDIHDIYLVREPEYGPPIEEPALTNVGRTHEDGWKTGSSGWGYKFDPERARRLLLRSQGTVLSAKKLAAGPAVPGRYFAIARCFRPDQVDATHAPDFLQIEGIALGEDITFKTLLGLLKLFALEVAQAKEIDFNPAYFPFTEPSVEVMMKHPKLGWMELGGSGIFRPEVTEPLGIDVPVIAWGLGIDRMAMMALDLHDIRDLFSADLSFIRARRLKN